MPTLDHQGVRYHWCSIGQGAQPAVFLHCSMASGKVWVPMMTRFADRLSSRAIDMPGHGGTGMPNPALDFQVQAAGATIALIEETGAPVHLVGHSYGATIALRVARERPDLLRSLVCIEPVYFSVLDDIAHPAYADVRREEDVATVPAKSEKMHAAIAGSKLVYIPKAGHSSPIENPEAVTAEIEAFIGQVDG